MRRGVEPDSTVTAVSQQIRGTQHRNSWNTVQVTVVKSLNFFSCQYVQLCR